MGCLCLVRLVYRWLLLCGVLFSLVYPLCVTFVPAIVFAVPAVVIFVPDIVPFVPAFLTSVPAVITFYT